MEDLAGALPPHPPTQGRTIAFRPELVSCPIIDQISPHPTTAALPRHVMPPYHTTPRSTQPHPAIRHAMLYVRLYRTKYAFQHPIPYTVLCMLYPVPCMHGATPHLTSPYRTTPQTALCYTTSPHLATPHNHTSQYTTHHTPHTMHHTPHTITTPHHTTQHNTVPHNTTPHHAFATPCLPCHALPCHAMPCHAMPCLSTPSHAISCLAMPPHACHPISCHVMRP